MENNRSSSIHPLWAVIVHTLDRAARATGVLTTLLSVAVFGASSLLFDFPRAGGIAVIVFCLGGVSEAFHRQRQAELHKRRQPLYKEELFLRFAAHRESWQPKVFDEFEYGGLYFRALGFHQIPAPLAVSVPLCPACQDRLVCQTTVDFPGRIKIVYRCRCGFARASKKTAEELQWEVAQITGIPTE